MHDSREFVSFLFVVLYLCGEPLYSIRIFSLLFHLSPLLGLFLAYVSDQPLLVAFVLISEACGYCFPPSFVGLLYLAKVVDLSLIQAFLPSKVYADFSSF